MQLGGFLACCSKAIHRAGQADLAELAEKYLGIIMAQTQVADHLIGHTVCCVCCQIKIKFHSLRRSCKQVSLKRYTEHCSALKEPFHGKG